MRWLVLIIQLLVAMMLPMMASAASEVGVISFVLGKAQKIAANGEERVLVVGDKLNIGDKIQTEDGSRVMLRMVDNASLSLRPNSRLTLQAYQYDEQQPAKTEIQWQLDYGAVRSITGVGGEANKAGYKLTTPLVAVGIRGTDYIVETTDKFTRAGLLTGAIVLTPNKDNCVDINQGTCPSSLVLDESRKNMLVEYVAGQAKPQFVIPSGDWLDKQLGKQSLSDSPKADGLASGTLDKAYLLSSSTTPESAKPTVEASLKWLPVNSPYSPDRVWLLSNELGSVQADNKINRDLPAQGQFNLALSQGYAKSLTEPTVPVTVSAGQLSFNMQDRSFTTQLDINSALFSQPQQLTSQGYVREDGRFYATSNQATQVSGVVVNNAQEAAYLFSQNLQGHYLIGSTLWQQR